MYEGRFKQNKWDLKEKNRKKRMIKGGLKPSNLSKSAVPG